MKVDLSNYGHNPCFSRNVFAILLTSAHVRMEMCHNPCFSRNVFAIIKNDIDRRIKYESQSLF